jgi:hypothetical protein
MNVEEVVVLWALLIITDISGNVPNTALSFRVALKASEFVTVGCMVLVQVISIGQGTVSCVFSKLGVKYVLKKKINVCLNIRYMRDRSVTSNHVLPQGNDYLFKL